MHCEIEINTYCCYSTAIDPAGIYLFKVNGGISSTMCEICSKLTTKTPERRQCSNSVFSNSLFIYSLFITINNSFSSP